MASIEVKDLSVSFKARLRGQTTLKDYFLFQFLRPRERAQANVVHALSDLTFKVEDGHRIGIVGHNGAGKSTLLKVLGGVYRPTTGSCDVEGRICSLFDISLGFEPDATGWDNILYRGYLQRETPKSIRAKSKGIAEFSE